MIGATAALLMSGCGSKSANSEHDATGTRTSAHESHGEPSSEAGEPNTRAVEHILASATTQLEARSGTEVHGTVTFTETGIKVGDTIREHQIVVAYDIQGLPPGAARGFHIHEYGDCSAPDASSAGGHFNPSGHDHGGPHDEHKHAGDLGNVTANEQGRAVGTLNVHPSTFTVAGNETNNIIGKSVIVHVAQDDYVSQPTGDAGPRAACGIIQLMGVD